MTIDCKALSRKLRDEIKDEVSLMEKKPFLAVFKVGEDYASEKYVKNKEKACKEAGIETKTYNLPADISEGDLIHSVHLCSLSREVTGVLVQLPLPKHIDEKRVIRAIDPSKDVDGFHPENVAKLWLSEPCVEPCTPKGIIAILDSIGFKYGGKNAVVLGRSNIVGKPIAKMLMDRGCTVTVCHSKTRDLSGHTRSADLIVSAVGKRNTIRRGNVYDANWDYYDDVEVVSCKNPVIIDVGINRGKDGKVCGDVDNALYKDHNLRITPVPGGVGVMTITMLLRNAVDLAKAQYPEKTK